MENNTNAPAVDTKTVTTVLADESNTKFQRVISADELAEALAASGQESGLVGLTVAKAVESFNAFIEARQAWEEAAGDASADPVGDAWKFIAADDQEAYAALFTDADEEAQESAKERYATGRKFIAGLAAFRKSFNEFAAVALTAEETDADKLRAEALEKFEGLKKAKAAVATISAIEEPSEEFEEILERLENVKGMRATSGSTAAAPKNSDKHIRDWARANGHPDVKEKGKLSPKIRAAYEEAHAS